MPHQVDVGHRRQETRAANVRDFEGRFGHAALGQQRVQHGGVHGDPRRRGPRRYFSANRRGLMFFDKQKSGRPNQHYLDFYSKE